MNQPYFDHEKLDVYQAALDFIILVEKIIIKFPKGRGYLSDQLQRASSSVSLNIAEGAGRSGSKEFAHFLDIARGSLAELDTQLEIAQMLNYLSPDPLITQQLNSVGALLTGLKKSIKGL